MHFFRKPFRYNETKTSLLLGDDGHVSAVRHYLPFLYFISLQVFNLASAARS
jgi:hypothetical protein